MAPDARRTSTTTAYQHDNGGGADRPTAPIMTAAPPPHRPGPVKSGLDLLAAMVQGSVSMPVRTNVKDASLKPANNAIKSGAKARPKPTARASGKRRGASTAEKRINANAGGPAQGGTVDFSNYKPARGRARAKQLASMTEDEIEAERLARLERNRVCARECRKRKKSKDDECQKMLGVLNQNLDGHKRTIATLESRIKVLERQLEQATSSAPSPPTGIPGS